MNKSQKANKKDKIFNVYVHGITIYLLPIVYRIDKRKEIVPIVCVLFFIIMYFKGGWLSF